MTNSQLQKFFFHRQTLLLIPIALFLWYTIDALGLSDPKNQKIETYRGKLNSIELLRDTVSSIVPGRSATYLSIKVLGLESISFEYLISERQFNSLNPKLKAGDEVVITAVRPKRVKDGRSDTHELQQLSVNNEIILPNDLSTAKKVSKNLALGFFVIFLVLFVIYVYWARIRIKTIGGGNL